MGDGPFDVVHVPAFVSHVEFAWQIPSKAAFLREFGSVLPPDPVRVKDLVAGSGLQFRERGAAELTGVPGEWRLFAVER